MRYVLERLKHMELKAFSKEIVVPKMCACLWFFLGLDLSFVCCKITSF